MTYSIAALQSLAASVGFPPQAVPIAAAVAMAESQGNPSASCINCLGVTERSFGLWQINTLAHPQYNETSLLQPVYNAQAALAVSSNGTNWTPWSTYTSGKYKQYLQPYTPGWSFGQVLALGIAAVGVGVAVHYIPYKMKPRWLR